MSDPARGAAEVEEGGVSTEVAPEAEVEESTETRRQPPYHVIILNDEDHTFDYVIELLCKLFKHPTEAAKKLTWKIHTAGRAVVFTTHKELAELKRDQVLAYGPDHRLPRSDGPLRCYIEPDASG